MKIKLLSPVFVLIYLLFSLPISVKAESYVDWSKVEILPSSSSATLGFINSTSTGFRVNLGLSDSYKPDSLHLFIGSCVNPVDSESFDNGSEYYLSTNTASLSELKALLLNCSGKQEGENIVEVKGFTGGLYQTIYSDIITSDFTAPVGIFSIEAMNGYIYKVGEKIDIVFDPNVNADVDVITGYVNDRELTFNKSGNKFIASYVISEGGADITDELILENISIIDLAGNLQSIAQESIPINFSIDANSPVVNITYPYENEVISKSQFEFIYLASGYETISFYLNDKLIASPMLSNLTTGDYILRIVALDKAGNLTVAQRSFRVDIIGPALSIISNQGEVAEGDEYSLSGESEPFSEVELTIGSKVYSTISDDLGKFNFKINDLKQGSYDYYLCAYDQYGNISLLNLGVLTIKAKPVTDSQSAVIARAGVIGDYEYDKVSVVSVSLEPPEDQKVAKQGKIISSSDERTMTGANYNSWLILIGLVIVSVAISSAGYYGYSLIGNNGKATELETEIAASDEIPDAEHEDIQTNSNSESIEEEKTDLRW